MKSLSKTTLLAASSVLVTASGARAQIDVNPPLPNVLILLDTSGSMENMLDGNTPESESATCAFSYTGPNIGNVAVNSSVALTGTAPNRWGVEMQALTGTMSPVYNCVSMPRLAGSYLNTEYSINGQAPYDNGYSLPFHRPVVGTDLGVDATSACVVSPGVLPGDPSGGVGNPMRGGAGLASDFPANAITTRLVNGNAGTCPFTQYQNGILDSAQSMIRFGLMTYDNDPAAGIGVTIPGLQVTNTPSSPFNGSWSYFPGWNGAGNPVTGNPADCSTPTVYQVGAKNPAAPPWEGRLIGFAAPTATSAQILTQNAQVQSAISALRPYGGTPTAGMFAGAQYYFWTDPAGPGITDPYVQGNCRDEYILHITDGVPNEDLRPACSQTPVNPLLPGTCPFPLPEVTAATLYLGGGGNHSVKTFVIGLAVSSIGGVACQSITPTDPRCQPSNALYPSFAACCELQKIAVAGGTNSAYFADTAGDLNAALGAIIATIAQNVTTRTTPAYSPSASSNSNQNQAVTNSSLFLSSFSPLAGSAWVGDVQRERFQCTFNNSAYTVPPPVIDPTQGDDFGANLNLPGAQGSRQFRSVIATQVGLTYPSDGTIRPSITNLALPGVHRDDFLGTQGGSLVGVVPSNILTIPPAALNISATSCANTLNTEYLTANACRDLALNFAMAQPSTDPMPDPTFTPFAARTGFALGAVYHSTPMVVGPPSADLDDPSYQAFASGPTVSARKTVLYVATVDGWLHAFDSNVTTATRTNGELWAFMPPGVLDGLLTAYPSANPLLLDGAPAVKDVVFDRSSAGGSLLLASNWHTALVAGFGAGHAGYYALDVSDPGPNTNLTQGVQFLWQLTSLGTYQSLNQTPLFGAHSATPAITTIFADLDGSGAHEIGVAILPGGSNGSATGGACARDAAAGNDAEPVGGVFIRRDSVQCWAAAGQPVVGRSVSIVRLDTGEVLRVFGRKVDLPAALIASNRVGIADTPLDSPMTGTPVVYPDTPGSIAQKFFIGDADGTVWRFDLTDTNPQNWTGLLYLDPYNKTVDTSSTAWSDGQPIEIPIVVATDQLGAVVVGIGTGDQETYTSTGNNYVYTVTEKPDPVSNLLRANVNWYVPYTLGERVSGPMTIFNSTLYWSTFAVSSGAAVCQGGTAKMWGRDYELPQTTADLSQGGIPRLQPPVAPPPTPPNFIVPSTYDPTLLGKLIPGVSVNVTPACADTSQTVTDQYTGGSHTMANYVTPGGYSLFAQVGGKNGGTNGAANSTFTVTLPAPTTSAVVDSWAAIVE
jgi:type IV pilus assembly protein PilY1